MDLIERLEAAEKGSRELDEDIGELMGWVRGVNIGRSPHYTSSIDAALMLVPEGAWDGTIMWRFGDVQVGGFVELNKANPAWLEPDYDPSRPPHGHAACVDSYEDQDALGPEDVKPRPLALALCIAALKACAETD